MMPSTTVPEAGEGSPITASESSRNLTFRVMDNELTNSKDKRGNVDPAEFIIQLIKSAQENHTIELLMFFHMFGYTCTNVTVQDLYIDRICRLEHNFSDSICENLTVHKTEEKIVEATASLFMMYRSMVEALIPVLFALFLGPFVDRNGTKLPILFSLIGYSLASLMYCISSMFPSIPASYLLICSIPISLTGGLVALLMSAFTLVSTKSTVASRSFRIAVLEGCWFLGTIGFLFAAKIYKVAGFVPVFLLSGSCFLIAFLYGAYFIQEPAISSVYGSSLRWLMTEIFDIQSVKDTVATVLKERPGPRKKWVIILMLTIFLRMLALFGTMQVAYLYTRNKFGWDNSDFSKFTTADTAICLTGGLATLLVMKILNVSDPIIGMFSALGFVISNICFASAQDGWVMYFGAVLQMFSGLITIVLRSMVSKCVAKDELAKAFSFVSIGEACIPILAGLLFNLLFSSTVNSFPGAVFALSSFFHASIFCSFVYFYFSTKNYPFHALLEEEAIQNNSF